jgi:DNA-binding NarL/FixJ family response regulator
MRILLAESDARVQGALDMLLKCEPGFIVVGKSRDTEGLLSKIRELEPDLILLDWDLPGLPHRSLQDILGDRDSPRVVIMGKRPELEAQAIAAGADAYLNKTDPPDHLLEFLGRMTAT